MFGPLEQPLPEHGVVPEVVVEELPAALRASAEALV
jgi:hypothetical protein